MISGFDLFGQIRWALGDMPTAGVAEETNIKDKHGKAKLVQR